MKVSEVEFNRSKQNTFFCYRLLVQTIDSTLDLHRRRSGRYVPVKDVSPLGQNLRDLLNIFVSSSGKTLRKFSGDALQQSRKITYDDDVRIFGHCLCQTEALPDRMR